MSKNSEFHHYGDWTEKAVEWFKMAGSRYIEPLRWVRTMSINHFDQTTLTTLTTF